MPRQLAVEPGFGELKSLTPRSTFSLLRPLSWHSNQTREIQVRATSDLCVTAGVGGEVKRPPVSLRRQCGEGVVEEDIVTHSFCKEH